MMSIDSCLVLMDIYTSLLVMAEVEMIHNKMLKYFYQTKTISLNEVLIFVDGPSKSEFE